MVEGRVGTAYRVRDNQRRATLIIVIRVLGLKRRTTREREPRACARETRASVSYAVPSGVQRDRPTPPRVVNPHVLANLRSASRSKFRTTKER